MTATSRPTARKRRLVAGGVAVPVALIGSMLGATGANAAPAGTKSQLVIAMQNAGAGTTVTLDADLLGDGGSNDVITLPSSKSVTLDLNGHDLDLDQIVVPTSAFLTLADGTGTGVSLAIGGASVASADTGPTGVQLAKNTGIQVGEGVDLKTLGSVGRAGIGTVATTDTNSVLYVNDGATVEATGGTHGAGIGGGDGAVPISTISITGATVTATGGNGAAAIGGGFGSTGAGSAVSIENGDVTLAGGTATTFSSFENAATGGGTSTVRVASGSTLTVPSGSTLRNSGDLLVNGTLTGAGTIDNADGTIRQGSGGTIADADLTVTGRNHAVSFASAGGTVTAPTTKHVYATTLANAGLDLAAYTGTSGAKSLVGWNTATATHVTNDDLLAALSTAGGESDPVALTAVYETPIAFTGTALPNAATGRRYERPAPVTGDATTFTVAANPASGLPSDTIPTFPSGLSIDAATGTISGTPATGGHYSFLLMASSPHQQRSQAVTLDVSGAPVIATSALPGGTTGTAYSAPVLATSESGAISYAVSRGTVPGGLQLDPVTGVLAGTPTAAGDFTFTVSATNAYGTVERSLSVAVAAPVPTTGTGTGTGGIGAGGTGGGGSWGTPVDGGSPAPSGGTTATTPTGAAAPVLPILGTTTVKLGHPLALSVAASSTVPVTYSVPAKELPAGITLDRGAGLLFGSPRVSGRFVLHLSATSSAGSATRTYSVLVPAVTRLVTGSTSAVTPRSGASMLVTIRGLKAGERWRVALNGYQVKTGVAKFGGSVKQSVRMPARGKDTTHRIRVSGDRRITDPSTTATHELTVTAVTAKKTLRLIRSGSTLTVRGLAAKERVTIRRGGKIVATGRADTHGVFVVRSVHLKKGTHTVTGSTKHRAGRLVVK